MKQNKETEDDICGKVIDIHHDRKIKKLNAELIRLPSDVGDTYFIELQDWTNEKGSKTLVRLHVQDAIELKSIIDGLLFDILMEHFDEHRLKYEEMKEGRMRKFKTLIKQTQKHFKEKDIKKNDVAKAVVWARKVKKLI